MGPATKGIEIQEGARGQIGDTIAVGETIRFGNLAFVKEDYKWQPAASPLAHAQIVPIGDIDIFIGYVSAGTEDQASDTEQVSENMEEPADDNYSIDYNSDDYADLIHPVLDEVDYGSDIEPLSDDFTNTQGVYVTIGNPDSVLNPLSTPITTENVVAQASELEAG
jgi:hypothetical protein